MNAAASATKNSFAVPTNIQNICFYLIGFCAIAIYCLVIHQNAYNIPKWDDFPEVLEFLDRWLAAGNTTDRFLAFTSQTNEHILLVNHFIILCQYYLIGHLNFAWLIYIGNIFYIGSALLLWFLVSDHSNRAYCFAVTMLVGVSFYPYDSTLWAMTAISNQAVIFFAFLAIYLSSRQKNNLPLVILLSTLAVFSQSNGLLLLLVIGFSYYSLEKWRDFKYWIVFTVAIASVYAYRFDPVSQQDQGWLSILEQLPLRNYALTAPTFLAYFGGSIFSELTMVSFLLSLIVGSGIVATVYIQLNRNLFTPVSLMIIGFLLLSIFSIAAYRGLFSGPEVAFVSRYKMYGAYFLITGVLLSPLCIARLQRHPVLKIGMLLICALYFTWSFIANLPHAKKIDGDLAQSLQRWVEDGDFRRAKGFFIRDADSYLFAALKNKTYNPMVLIDNATVITDIKKIDSCQKDDTETLAITTDFVIVHKNPNAAGIKVISLLDGKAALEVKLCSTEISYQFEIRSAGGGENQVAYFINRDDIAAGTYSVLLRQGETHYRLENPFVNKRAIR